MSTLTLRRPPRVFSTLTGSAWSTSVKRSIPSQSQKPHLMQYDELPAWYQDNPKVRTLYRPVSFSAVSCFQSWTYLHNETVNIFTHLVPALFFLALHTYFQRRITDTFPDVASEDRFIFSLNLLAMCITLLLSSTYHTLINHSKDISHIWLRIDYVGILTLIFASFFSGIHVGFYCDPLPRWIYWSMITIFSLITSALVLHPGLQGLEYRACRTSAFVLTGLSGFAPIIHGLCQYGWHEMWVRSGMPYWFLEGIVYGTGAFLFATRFSESIWPGKFDMWGSSHQIFHILVVAGALVHLRGVWNAFAWNYEHNRSCNVA